MLQQDINRVIFKFTATQSFQNSKIPNDKNKKSCDQNDETFWSHDSTKIEIAFEISCGDVDSLVIFVILEILALLTTKLSRSKLYTVGMLFSIQWALI